MTPEERARQKIDLLLQQSGWIVQDRSQTNLAAGPGVAIREALLKTGVADYLLFAGGKAIATVEAKPEGNILKQSMSVLYRLVTSNDPCENRWRKPTTMKASPGATKTRAAFTRYPARRNSPIDLNAMVERRLI